MFFFAMNAFFMWNFYSPKSFSSYSKFYSYFFLLLWKHFNTWLKYLQNVTLKDLKCEMKMFLRTVQDKLKVFFSEMICKKIQKGLKMAKIIINLPGCLIQQAFRSMDKRFVRSLF